MRRRAFLGGALAFGIGPVRAAEPRFTVSGPLEQGSLALGAAPPGSVVALDGRPLDVTAEGRFVFGFGYDQTKASLVTVRYPDGAGDSRSYARCGPAPPAAASRSVAAAR